MGKGLASQEGKREAKGGNGGRPRVEWRRQGAGDSGRRERARVGEPRREDSMWQKRDESVGGMGAREAQ